MEYTLEEIKKHKIKISNLSIQLINTNNIADEIMLNNEIKNETNYILSLLNIKINEIQLNNNIINNNNQNFNIITQQEILAHQQMFAQQQIGNPFNTGSTGIFSNHNQNISKAPIIQVPKAIDVFFTEEKSDGQGKEKSNIFIQCFPDDKVSTAINKYRNIINDFSNNKKFYFNDLILDENLSVGKAGLYHNSKIKVFNTIEEKEEKNKTENIIRDILNLNYGKEEEEQKEEEEEENKEYKEEEEENEHKEEEKKEES